MTGQILSQTRRQDMPSSQSFQLILCTFQLLFDQNAVVPSHFDLFVECFEFLLVLASLVLFRFFNVCKLFL